MKTRDEKLDPQSHVQIKRRKIAFHLVVWNTTLSAILHLSLDGNAQSHKRSSAGQKKKEQKSPKPNPIPPTILQSARGDYYNADCIDAWPVLFFSWQQQQRCSINNSRVQDSLRLVRRATPLYPAIPLFLALPRLPFYPTAYIAPVTNQPRRFLRLVTV